MHADSTHKNTAIYLCIKVLIWEFFSSSPTSLTSIKFENIGGQCLIQGRASSLLEKEVKIERSWKTKASARMAGKEGFGGVEEVGSLLK